jgi:hypothetical protein
MIVDLLTLHDENCEGFRGLDASEDIKQFIII